MDIDGKTYFESKAMARLMARKAGIAGKDDYEACMADAIIYYITDLQDAFYMVVFMPPEKTVSIVLLFKSNNHIDTKQIVYSAHEWELMWSYFQEEMKAAYKKKMDEFMPCLEKQLSQNNGGDGYFVGDDVSNVFTINHNYSHS